MTPPATGPVTVVLATVVVTSVVVTAVVVPPGAVLVTVFVTVAELTADDCPAEVELEVALLVVVAVVADSTAVVLEALAREWDDEPIDGSAPGPMAVSEADCAEEPSSPQPARADVRMARVNREAKTSLNLFKQKDKVKKTVFSS